MKPTGTSMEVIWAIVQGEVIGFAVKFKLSACYPVSHSADEGSVENFSSILIPFDAAETMDYISQLTIFPGNTQTDDPTTIVCYSCVDVSIIQEIKICLLPVE